MKAVSVVSGIFFKARIAEAMKKGNVEHAFCSGKDELRTYKPNLIILDLEHPDARKILQEFGNKVIAFGPHLKLELLAIGRDSGAQVFSRSTFFSNLDHVLGNHA